MRKTLSDLVAERLRAEMAIQQVKPSELAKRLGVSHMYVARRMTGETSIDLRSLEAIAGALEISPARLLACALDVSAVA